MFKILVKDDELNCFDDILVYIKKLLQPEKRMINLIITICKFLLVNLATSTAGERMIVFHYSKVENMAPFENDASQVHQPDYPQQS